MKTAFGNNFEPRKVPQPETHEIESAGFIVWALPEVKICFRTQFLHKDLYNYCSKKNLSVSSKQWRLKKWIFHCIFEM